MIKTTELKLDRNHSYNAILEWSLIMYKILAKIVCRISLQKDSYPNQKSKVVKVAKGERYVLY